MDPIKITYGASHRYLYDTQPFIRDAVFKAIEGNLRARNLAILSDLVNLFGVDYLTPEEFQVCRQISAFFKKNVAFCDESVALASARSAFVSAEKRCRITNRRLDYYYIQRDRLDPDLNLWLSRMEADIANLLGPFSEFLESLPERLKVTAGASALHPRRRSQPYVKVSKRMDCTPSAVQYLAALSEFFGYGEVKPRKVLHNRVEFVPKNWKTHRTIACEPAGNVPLQLAFDDYAKHRLLRWGVNLRDQTANQQKALAGSMGADFATIDLSAASDTVSFNVVAWLFPKPFFDFLNHVRSPRYKWEGRSLPYAKFSSMGNGATFSIESVLFAAACRAVGSTQYSVYGDDIIIETGLVDSLTKLFKFLGFSINGEKSFVHGPFRESCGLDAYNGVNVTPFYIRELDSRKVTQVHLVNGLVSIAKPGGKLAQLCARLVKDEALPLAPPSESTISGIHILEEDAIRLGLIRSRRKYPWVPMYQAYVPKVKFREVADTRTLFLWHLSRYSQAQSTPRVYGLFKGHSMVVDESTSVTSVPTFSHRYRRRWVHWYPVPNVPGHLYWWSEFLLRR